MSPSPFALLPGQLEAGSEAVESPMIGYGPRLVPTIDAFAGLGLDGPDLGEQDLRNRPAEVP